MRYVVVFALLGGCAPYKPGPGSDASTTPDVHNEAASCVLNGAACSASTVCCTMTFVCGSASGVCEAPCTPINGLCSSNGECCSGICNGTCQ